MYVTVSKPINVEIEDLETKCTYCYQGRRVIDCEKYFLSLFDDNRPYAIRFLNML